MPELNSEDLGAALAKHLAPVIREVREIAASANRGPAAPEKDELKEAIDAIMASSADGTVRIDQVLSLLEVHGKELTKTQSRGLNEILMTERRARAYREITEEIDKYAENDELIEISREKIVADFIKEFDTSDEYKLDRSNFWQSGQLQPTVKRALVKKLVDRIDKAAGNRSKTPSDKGTPGITKKVEGGTGNRETDRGASVDTSTLTTAQKDLYGSHYGLLIRSGKKPDEAAQQAMTAALRRKA